MTRIDLTDNERMLLTDALDQFMEAVHEHGQGDVDVDELANIANSIAAKLRLS